MYLVDQQIKSCLSGLVLTPAYLLFWEHFVYLCHLPQVRCCDGLDNLSPQIIKQVQHVYLSGLCPSFPYCFLSWQVYGQGRAKSFPPR